MSKHREHLQKLGHDVQTLGKRLEEALREDGKSTNIGGKYSANKMLGTHLPRNSSTQKMCDHRKIKGKPRASVEVTVKTKRSGKTYANNTKSFASGSSVPHNLSGKYKLMSHQPSEHFYCKSQSKDKENKMWDNILKNSMTDSLHAVNNAKENDVADKESKMRRDETSNEKVTELNGCPNCKNLISGRTYFAPSDSGGKNKATNSISCLSHDDACQAGMTNSNFGFYSSNVLNSGMEHVGLLGSKNCSVMNPIEKLGILLQELNQKLTVDDESMKKLAGKMQLTLWNLVENMSAAGFNSGEGPHLVGRLSSRRMFEQNPILAEGNGTKEKYIERNAVETTKSQKEKIVSENNFEIPAETVNEKEIQVNLPLESDEKLKLEVVDLKRQLDVQLKSIDRVTAKESEYHSLLVNLLDKVKNLEDQVVEQRKGANNFLLQNNALREQNSVIPALQASQDLLQRRLQQVLNDYENLKVDYHLLKLEKEKYSALNDARDKEIKRFQGEIRDFQLLVEKQMDNLRKVEKSETTANKAEALLNVIDSQANFIKSKLGLAKLEEEVSTSFPSIPDLSAISEVISTKSVSKKESASDLDKHSKDNLFKQYLLNVPELESPNSS